MSQRGAESESSAAVKAAGSLDPSGVFGGRIGAIARAIGIEPFLVGAISLALSLATMLPGLGFWDTAEFQTVGPVLGTAHPTGFPSFVIAEWLASIVLQPLGNPAFEMNLFSGICIAVATALVAVLGRQLTGNRLLGAGAALAFTLAPSVWRMGTRADPHAFHIVLVGLLIVLLVAWEQRQRSGSRTAKRWFLAAALVYGLALGNHGLALLYAPGIAAFVIAVDRSLLRRPGLLLAGFGVLIATGLLEYAELPIRALMNAPLVYGTPGTPAGFVYVVLAQQFHGSFIETTPGQMLATAWSALWTEIGPLVILVVPAAVITAIMRPRFALLTIPTWLITVAFASAYSDADIGRFYNGPTLISVAWMAVAAAAVLRVGRRIDRRIDRTADRPDARSAVPGLAQSAQAILLAGLIAVPVAAQVPAEWNRLDVSGDRLAPQWLDATFNALEPNAVVCSWWSYSTTLFYGQKVEGRRPDVWIVDDRTRLDMGLNLDDLAGFIDSQLPTRPVYVIRPERELAPLAERFNLDIVGAGLLVKVSAKTGTGS